MINYYIIRDHAIYALSQEELKTIKPIWINIVDPTPEEEMIMKDKLGIDMSINKTATPVVLPSCYYKADGQIFTTMHIVTDDNKIESLAYILSTEELITVRCAAVPANIAYLSYVAQHDPTVLTPVNIYIYFMEARLIHIREAIQKVNDNIDMISQQIFYPDSPNQNQHFRHHIDSLGKNGHLLAKNNESLISIQSALSMISDSKIFKLSKLEGDKINGLIIGGDTLANQVSFLSDKMDFLLNICFGMIGLKQSDISKVFSVAALVFLPPTIITSAYGMNFDKIPFSHLEYGFEFAIVAVFLSACLPYLICKLKNWI